MRLPKYISPSSLKTFESNRQEFFLKYLADNRPERMPQTQPMAVGSAFDAYVKSHIYYSLFGNYGSDNQYEKETIFESQVEPQNRDFGAVAGKHVFEKYSYSGALSNMMLELNKAAGPPRFEFNIEGVISGKCGDIPLLGKPDIFFINDQAARVVWDWKVNGYCGKTPTSPVKGYTKCIDTWSSLERKSSRNNGGCHPECVLQDHLGIKINVAMYMESCNAEWADQLAIYSWLLGEEIGSEQLIVGIDQIVGAGPGPNNYPYLRIANHRTRISSEYQFTLQDRLNYCWSAIKSGHIFGELSREENDLKIRQLEEMATALAADDPLSKFVNREARFQ